ncbi:hypothetical protein GA0115255_102384 [Streptomyces sp. Ncost-T6T-2b]|nr:hypothetical protein GA0115255_102384 [Streptomyces sp. Ncost-T6T-2b]
MVAVPLVAVINTVVGYLRSYGEPGERGGQHGATALSMTPAHAGPAPAPPGPGPRDAPAERPKENRPPQE